MIILNLSLIIPKDRDNNLHVIYFWLSIAVWLSLTLR